MAAEFEVIWKEAFLA